VRVRDLDEIRYQLAERLDAIRLNLARPDALVPLSALGLATGLAAGAVIVAFRFLVEYTQEGLLPDTGSENYEALAPAMRFLLPLAGGVMLAAMFRWFARGAYMLGVARVMERIAYHQGHLTARGFVLQFFGAAIAIISGHSVGREGPHVFLGAAAGSLLGQQFSLPNNTIRTLVACGTAAGIGASFNTPLAGVVFALEVVMMEYSVTSFIPVILASVSATTLSNAILGDDVAFSMSVVDIDSVRVMGLVLVLGFLVGTVSALLNHLLEIVAATMRPIAIWWRMLLAGATMGLIGVLVPQVMGIGYDTVQLALEGQVAVGLVAVLLAAKIVASCVSLGPGVPGGVIGPSLFIGAMAGALVAEVVMLLDVAHALPVGTFALLGMGAAMSASLQAPLAGLTAMLELTDNPAIILPGMLAVVVSGITARELFGKDSLFVTQLRAAGLDYRSNPVLQALRRRGVGSVMHRGFARTRAHLSLAEAQEVLAGGPEWLLVDPAPGPGQDEADVIQAMPAVLMPAVDLARHIESGAWRERVAGEENEIIDLMEMPAARRQVGPIELQATLQEALERLDQADVEALYVQRATVPTIPKIYGILTRSMIERTYHE
jgi:H+/Cl- antiporter ClcA